MARESGRREESDVSNIFLTESEELFLNVRFTRMPLKL